MLDHNRMKICVKIHGEVAEAVRNAMIILGSRLLDICDFILADKFHIVNIRDKKRIGWCK